VQSLVVKELLKSVNIYRRHGQNFDGSFLRTTGYVLHSFTHIEDGRLITERRALKSNEYKLICTTLGIISKESEGITFIVFTISKFYRGVIWHIYNYIGTKSIKHFCVAYECRGRIRIRRNKNWSTFRISSLIALMFK